MTATSIGVDIGTTAVRAVEATVKKGQPVIRHAWEVRLPDEAIVNGEVRDPAVLTNALKMLWDSGFRSKEITIGIGQPQTIVRQVDVPYEPGEDFRETLPVKVADDLPVAGAAVSELSLDYYPLGDYTDTNSVPRRRALLVGATSLSVENLVLAAVEAGLRPVGVDFSGFALIRAAAFTAGTPNNVPGPSNSGERYPVEIVIDVGATKTLVIVHREGRPLYARIAPDGGNAVTQAISDNLRLRWDVAEAAKRYASGHRRPSRTAAALLAEIPREQRPMIDQIVSMMASSLAHTARESIELFMNASPQVTGISRVVLSGDGSLLHGYANRLGAETRAPVALLTPMGAFSPSSERDAFSNLDPRFGIAFGLALGVQG